MVVGDLSALWVQDTPGVSGLLPPHYPVGILLEATVLAPLNGIKVLGT